MHHEEINIVLLICSVVFHTESTRDTRFHTRHTRAAAFEIRDYLDETVSMLVCLLVFIHNGFLSHVI